MFQQIVGAWLLTVLIIVSTTSLSQATRIRTICGTPIQTITLTEDEQFETTSTTFVRVTGAFQDVTVPAGTTRCIKVRFTAGARCQGGSGSESCFIRARANGVEMNPAGGGTQGISGRAFSKTGLSFHWVGRFDPGSYRLDIQVRSDATNTATVGVDDWTMDIEILN